MNTQATEVQRKKGHNTLSIIEALTKGEVGNRTEQIPLVFVEREVKKGVIQRMSMLDTEGGIPIYPMLVRFNPVPGKKYLCHVVFRTIKDRRSGDEKKVGYAIPVSLVKLNRDEWKPPMANVMTVKLHPIRNGDEGEAKFFGFANNGKKVVGFDDDFKPDTAKPTRVLVAERFSCFVICGEAPEEEQVSDSKALVLYEAVSAILNDIDPFMVIYDGLNYDACTVLDVERNATEREIKKAARTLLASNSPDRKIGEFRDLFSHDPDEATRDEFENAYKLIQVCRDKLLLVCLRRDATAKYGSKGQSFSKALKIKALAKAVEQTPEDVLAALKEVGWDLPGKAEVNPTIAKTVSGYFALKAEEKTKSASA